MTNTYWNKTVWLATGWAQIDEAKLQKYASKIGNSAVAKRLGFLMEELGLAEISDENRATVMRTLIRERLEKFLMLSLEEASD